MRVLVTGGNGFIGSTVVRILHKRGYTVRCTLRETSNTSRIDSIPFEKTIADIRDPESLKKAIDGCDGLIHCASLSNWKDLNSPALREIIVGGTQNLVKLIEGTNIKMVYLSSAAALGSSKTPDAIRSAESRFNLAPQKYRYAAHKAEAEKLCLEAHRQGAHVSMVHPTETYGPEDSDLVTASTLIDFSKGPICLTCKGGTSIAHVEDVAHGIVAALEKGKSGEKYVLGGDNLSINQLAALTQEVYGSTHPVLTVPSFVMKAFVALCSGLKIGAIQAIVTKYRYATHYWFFDNKKTIDELGVSFRSPRKTIEQTLTWLKQENLLK